MMIGESAMDERSTHLLPLISNPLSPFDLVITDCHDRRWNIHRHDY
jgi:hypothetical protein